MNGQNLEPVGLSAFYGGMSIDLKFGTKAQFYYARHIDFPQSAGPVLCYQA